MPDPKQLSPSAQALLDALSEPGAVALTDVVTDLGAATPTATLVGKAVHGWQRAWPAQSSGDAIAELEATGLTFAAEQVEAPDPRLPPFAVRALVVTRRFSSEERA